MRSIFSFPKKGFTLVELLVVVAILSIVGGMIIIMINPLGVQQRSRDARRKTDLEAIRQALELYRADNGEYPTGGWYGSAHSNWSSFTSQIAPDFISQVPIDPQNTATGYPGPCSSRTLYRYNYRSVSSNQEYILTAIMENEGANDDSECSELPNWGSNCGGVPATDDYCYGVQNP